MNRKLVEQFIKFGFVGVTNTAIALLVYYVLVWLGCSYIFANTMGFLLSVGNAYFWNSRYVFTKKTEQSAMKAFLKLFISYLGSFCMSTILITTMIELLGISVYVAPILRLIVTVPINFIINKLWAFKDKN